MTRETKKGTEDINSGPVTVRIRALTADVPLRLLVVDDDELECRFMADRLQSCGFDVATASTGREALAILECENIPLVLTDRQMPSMDGIEFTEHLRQVAGHTTYIIMLTVCDSADDYERGYLAGVNDYLSKKAPTTEVLARIHAAFETLRLRQALLGSGDARAD